MRLTRGPGGGVPRTAQPSSFYHRAPLAAHLPGGLTDVGRRPIVRRSPDGRRTSPRQVAQPASWAARAPWRTTTGGTPMDLGLKGKRAVVTGGSRGIGRAVAEAFAAEGAHVSICARKADEVAGTVAALKSRGVQAFGRALDVADPQALGSWIAATA